MPAADDAAGKLGQGVFKITPDRGIESKTIFWTLSADPARGFDMRRASPPARQNAIVGEIPNLPLRHLTFMVSRKAACGVLRLVSSHPRTFLLRCKVGAKASFDYRVGFSAMAFRNIGMLRHWSDNILSCCSGSSVGRKRTFLFLNTERTAIFVATSHSRPRRLRE
jgi:hypothetical protein